MSTFWTATVACLVILFCVVGVQSIGVCDDFPCGPVGACVPATASGTIPGNRGTPDGTKNGVGFSCTCDEGFEPAIGGGPCVDIDECRRGPVNPCGQFGHCRNALGYYECDCEHGSVATVINGALRCIKESNACEDNPCGSAGICHPQQDGSHVCECMPGYEATGGNGKGPCKARVDPCVGNPCGEGGTCSAVVGDGYRCTCLPGYSQNAQFARIGGGCHARAIHP
ncbi:hypothetical protein CBR_g17860 [Chara braunii]|uniref:EGF-like domain-containing protein n=1 Tax=Chara braunii TaxID=69332 RepID=A0A388KVS4_CHABU|nr:hypothetical protein CBR_g17860 [Chara braunii]|eukprot:GBG74147.1 hypothetical protein CBR_g17860 [Chara braunii]